MGLDMGIEKAGFEIRLACEIDKYCRQTIALNKPEIALLSDINEYSKEDILRAAGLSRTDQINLVIGGPPCQAFSTAGKRQSFRENSGNVFLKYIDLSIAMNPRHIVIENVRGLLSCPLKHRPHSQRGQEFTELSAEEIQGGAMNYILKKLKNHGYNYSFNLYNSANFGTPQIRERVIIICSRDKFTAPYLTPTHSEEKIHLLPKWKTLEALNNRTLRQEIINFCLRVYSWWHMHVWFTLLFPASRS